MDEHDAPLLAPTATAAYAWQLLRLHRPALALAMAEQLLTADPADLAARLARTEALCQLGHLEAATEAAQETIALAPPVAAGHFALAQVHGQQENFHSARAAALEAIRLAPTNADYLGFLAYLHYQHIDLTEAITAAKAGLLVSPRHPACLQWLMLSYEDNQQFSEADSVAQSLLRAAPDAYETQANVGLFLLRKAEPARAAIHLQEALHLMPSNSAELLPALQQACRWQTWPRWLVRWGLPTTASRSRFRLLAWCCRLVVWPLVLAYSVRSQFFLPQDARLPTCFQAATRHQRHARLRYPWASTPLAWVLLILFILCFVCFFTFVLNLRTGPTFLVLYLLARYFMKLEDES